jgi:predicted nucleic acid-binding protein
VISVDTSVVVRYLVGTPEDQALRAKALLDGEDEIAISVIALIETAHVLRTQYDVPRAEVLDTLIDLLSRKDMVLLGLSREDALAALVRARELPGAPLPDALVVAMSQAAGAVPVYTFDEDLRRHGVPVATP